jgi:hypothetical protein
MASTKLAFLAVAVLLLQASWCAVARARHHHDQDPCGNPDLAHHCSSLAVSLPNGGTPAVMTVTSFDGGDGGDPEACDGIYVWNGDPLAALSTEWFAGGSRCHKSIRITSTQTGRTVVADVVDECDKDNMVSTNQVVWDALGLDTNIGEVPVTWSDA